MDWPIETGLHELGDLPLFSGEVLRGARLSWRTHGTLSPARDNVVVYPTSYGATHEDIEWLVGPDGVLDPRRWFVVIPDMFANGRSSSPSTQPDYPALVTAADNVRAQRRLLTERWGIERVACAYGFSMGAQQAYHWAALFPDAVERAVVVCGSARTAVHNQVFLRSLLAVLEAAPEHMGGGRFSAEPVAAKRAFARVYAGWAMSQDWYRANLHLRQAPDLERFLDEQWSPSFTRRPAANAYAQARGWEASDVAEGGDLPAALGRIGARVLLLPSETDLYFRVADNAAELPHLRHGRLLPIPTIWGHRAGSPAQNPEDLAFLRAVVRDWLEH